MVVACGLAPSLPILVAARLACGLATGWIVPFALAFVGDVIPYERRQQVLGRFLSGQILGQMFGQAAGGVLGDYFGWRNVFFILAALLAIATLGLFYELWRNPITRAGHAAAQPGGGFVADYSMVLRSPWSRMVIAVAFIEAAAMFGAFTYVGADLHLRFGVNFALVGLFVGTFAIGGLIYSISVRVLFDRFGPVGLATGGGIASALAYVALAFEPHYWIAPIRHHWRSGSASTCCTTRCRPTPPKCRRKRAAPRCRCSPLRLYLGQTAAVALAASCSTASPRCRCFWRGGRAAGAGLVVRAPAEAPAGASVILRASEASLEE